MVSREKGEISSALLVCIQMQCTGAPAGSDSEGATLSQFIILTKKGKTLVKTVDREGYFIIIIIFF